MKAKRVAEYFCDERSIDDFIENVFKEIWKFIEAFQSAEQVRSNLVEASQ